MQNRCKSMISQGHGGLGAQSLRDTKENMNTAMKQRKREWAVTDAV